MIAQSTLISYHTEAFVKTESACTVPFLHQFIINRGLNVLQIQQMIHYLVAIKLHSFDLQEKLEFPFE